MRRPLALRFHSRQQIAKSPNHKIAKFASPLAPLSVLSKFTQYDEQKMGGSISSSSAAAIPADAFNPKRTLIVGGDGISLDEFLTRPVDHWL